MSKKRNITAIIVVVVCAVCALLFVFSGVIDWSVDQSGSKGDIAKSSRFQRKTVNIEQSNMEELLANDQEYRNNVVVAYAVMQTRASQFEALVDMSVQVADDIKDFEGVLTDMKAIKPMLSNVVASMKEAGSSLNTALGGENSKELSQNTNNAALAYSTLQKQNELADRFITIADEYVKKGKADDKLKVVRDEWVEYQIMTSVLEGDEKKCDQLVNSGYLLTSDKAVTALNEFDRNIQLALQDHVTLQTALGLSKFGVMGNSESLKDLNSFKMNENGVINARQELTVMNNVFSNNDIVASFGANMQGFDHENVLNSFQETIKMLNNKFIENSLSQNFEETGVMNQNLQETGLLNQNLQERGSLNQNMQEIGIINQLPLGEFLNQTIMSTIVSLTQMQENQLGLLRR
ncbi:MAG: hypothetical protein IJU24_03410 [Bacteroidaceae bacterium]|nr:hypothetical protein [Bacteroidaceae bacterium]